MITSFFVFFKTKIEVVRSFQHHFLLKRFSEWIHQNCNKIHRPFISVPVRNPADIIAEKSPSKLRLDQCGKQNKHRFHKIVRTTQYRDNGEALYRIVTA